MRPIHSIEYYSAVKRNGVLEPGYMINLKDTKATRLYDSTNMKCSEQERFRDRRREKRKGKDHS